MKNFCDCHVPNLATPVILRTACKNCGLPRRSNSLASLQSLKPEQDEAGAMGLPQRCGLKLENSPPKVNVSVKSRRLPRNCRRCQKNRKIPETTTKLTHQASASAHGKQQPPACGRAAYSRATYNDNINSAGQSSSAQATEVGRKCTNSLSILGHSINKRLYTNAKHNTPSLLAIATDALPNKAICTLHIPDRKVSDQTLVNVKLDLVNEETPQLLLLPNSNTHGCTGATPKKHSYMNFSVHKSKPLPPLNKILNDILEQHTSKVGQQGTASSECNFRVAGGFSSYPYYGSDTGDDDGDSLSAKFYSARERRNSQELMSCNDRSMNSVKATDFPEHNSRTTGTQPRVKVVEVNSSNLFTMPDEHVTNKVDNSTTTETSTADELESPQQSSARFHLRMLGGVKVTSSEHDPRKELVEPTEIDYIAELDNFEIEQPANLQTQNLPATDFNMEKTHPVRESTQKVLCKRNPKTACPLHSNFQCMTAGSVHSNSVESPKTASKLHRNVANTALNKPQHLKSNSNVAPQWKHTCPNTYSTRMQKAVNVKKDSTQKESPQWDASTRLEGGVCPRLHSPYKKRTFSELVPSFVSLSTFLGENNKKDHQHLKNKPHLATASQNANQCMPNKEHQIKNRDAKQNTAVHHFTTAKRPQHSAYPREQGRAPALSQNTQAKLNPKGVALCNNACSNLIKANNIKINELSPRMQKIIGINKVTKLSPKTPCLYSSRNAKTAAMDVPHTLAPSETKSHLPHLSSDKATTSANALLQARAIQIPHLSTGTTARAHQTRDKIEKHLEKSKDIRPPIEPELKESTEGPLRSPTVLGNLQHELTEMSQASFINIQTYQKKSFSKTTPAEQRNQDIAECAMVKTPHNLTKPFMNFSKSRSFDNYSDLQADIKKFPNQIQSPFNEIKEKTIPGDATGVNNSYSTIKEDSNIKETKPQKQIQLIGLIGKYQKQLKKLNEKSLVSKLPIKARLKSLAEPKVAQCEKSENVQSIVVLENKERRSNSPSLHTNEIELVPITQAEKDTKTLELSDGQITTKAAQSTTKKVQNITNESVVKCHAPNKDTEKTQKNVKIVAGTLKEDKSRKTTDEHPCTTPNIEPDIPAQQEYRSKLNSGHRMHKMHFNKFLMRHTKLKNLSERSTSSLKNCSNQRKRQYQVSIENNNSPKSWIHLKINTDNQQNPSKKILKRLLEKTRETTEKTGENLVLLNEYADGKQISEFKGLAKIPKEEISGKADCTDQKNISTIQAHKRNNNTQENAVSAKKINRCLPTTVPSSSSIDLEVIQSKVEIEIHDSLQLAEYIAQFQAEEPLKLTRRIAKKIPRCLLDSDVAMTLSNDLPKKKGIEIQNNLKCQQDPNIVVNEESDKRKSVSVELKQVMPRPAKSIHSQCEEILHMIHAESNANHQETILYGPETVVPPVTTLNLPLNTRDIPIEELAISDQIRARCKTNPELQKYYEKYRVISHPPPVLEKKLAELDLTKNLPWNISESSLNQLKENIVSDKKDVANDGGAQFKQNHIAKKEPPGGMPKTKPEERASCQPSYHLPFNKTPTQKTKVRKCCLYEFRSPDVQAVNLKFVRNKEGSHTLNNNIHYIAPTLKRIKCKYASNEPDQMQETEVSHCQVDKCGKKLKPSGIMAHYVNDHCESLVNLVEIYGNKCCSVKLNLNLTDQHNRMRFVGILAYGGRHINDRKPVARGLCEYNLSLPFSFQNLSEHLPIMLMAYQSSSSALLRNPKCAAKLDDLEAEKSQLFFIWTECYAPPFALSVSLTARDRKMRFLRSIVCNPRYYDRNIDSVNDFIAKEKNYLMLNYDELMRMTNNFQDTLHIDIMVNEGTL